MDDDEPECIGQGTLSSYLGASAAELRDPDDPTPEGKRYFALCVSLEKDGVTESVLLDGRDCMNLARDILAIMAGVGHPLALEIVKRYMHLKGESNG